MAGCMLFWSSHSKSRLICKASQGHQGGKGPNRNGISREALLVGSPVGVCGERQQVWHCSPGRHEAVPVHSVHHSDRMPPDGGVLGVARIPAAKFLWPLCIRGQLQYSFPVILQLDMPLRLPSFLKPIGLPKRLFSKA